MNGTILVLKTFVNLKRWYEDISKREAVQKGYDLLNKGEQLSQKFNLQ